MGLIHFYKRAGKRIFCHRMEGTQDASMEAEGQFGKPEFFARSGVNARMDSKFQHHPLMPREAMGAAMPLKLSMERKAASKVGHFPCLSAGRSMASLEALTGADMAIGFDDVYGKAEDFEMLPPLPFNAIQKTLDEF